MSYSEKLTSFINTPRYSRECQYMVREISTRMSLDPVLSIGCGLGGVINCLEQNGVDVYGIDPGSHVRYLSLNNRKVCRSYGENIPFTDKSFSVVYFMHSFAHLNNCRQTLQETRRVLKEDGLLCIITPNRQFETLIQPVKNLLEKIGKYHPDKTVTGHYEPKQLAKLLQSENFSSVTINTFGLAGLQRILAVART